MKKGMIFVLVMLVVSVVFVSIAWAEETWKIQDGKLIHTQIIKKIEEKFPVPPGGVPVEIAAKLVKGELSEYILEGEIKSKLVKFFPVPVKRITISQTKITFEKKWKEEELLPKELERTHWLVLIFWMIFPSALIMFNTVLTRKYQSKGKTIFVFYGIAIGVSVIMSTFAVVTGNADLNFLGQYIVFIFIICLVSFILSVIFRQPRQEQAI